MITVKYDSVFVLSTLLKSKGFSATVSATYQPPGETYYSAMVVESDGKRLQTSFEEFGEIPEGIPAEAAELYALHQAVLLAIAQRIKAVCTASLPTLRVLDMALKGIRVPDWASEIIKELVSYKSELAIYAIKPYKKAASLAQTPFNRKNRQNITGIAVYQHPENKQRAGKNVMFIPDEIFNLFLQLGDGDPDKGLLLFYRRYMSI